MTDKPTRRRRRALLVPLLGIGVAAWAARSRFTERRTLHDGWQPLPPSPVAAAATATAAPAPVVEPVEPESVVTATGPESVAEATPESVAQLELAEPFAEATPEPEPVAEATPEPVLTRARTVPAATAVASVTVPALPDAPFGAGSAPARDDGASPGEEYVVKGKTATRVFYAPGSPYYARTRADVWFRTPDDARAAGFAPRVARRSG